MEITAGIACGLKLADLPEEYPVRPTSVRSRRAFFDSLGTLDGKVFADCFAGSGIMGLEAASRGASEVISAEESPSVLALIRKNSARVQRTGITARFHLIPGTLPKSLHVRVLPPRPDIVFADPPYAASMSLLEALTGDSVFTEWASCADLFWELPDFPCDLKPPKAPWHLMGIRQLGASRFLLIRQQS